MNKTISNKMIDTLADRAILKSAEEENIELGVALKNISEDDLKRILRQEKRSALHNIPHLKNIKPHFGLSIAAIVNHRRLWIEAASFALLIAVSALWIFNVNRSADTAIYNTLVAYNYVSSSRDGIEMKDISNMSQDELRNYIPVLQKAFNNASIDDIQECQVTGMNLAMAYLKLHEREKTITLLNELKIRFNFDENYVAKCNKIINLLE